MPVAEEATRYFRSGKPFLHNYLPYWAANFVDRTLILLIPVFAVLLPAIKIAPWLYTYRLRSRIFRWYEQLTEVEMHVAHDRNPATEQYLARLDAIEGEITAAHLPSWLREQAYLLRGAIEMVRDRLRGPEETTTTNAPLPEAHRPTRDPGVAELGTPGGLA